MGGTKTQKTRFQRMGPREQDNDMLLLVVVALICAALVSIPTKPAAAAKPTVFSGEATVRVVLPFNPNTMPSERQ